MPHLDINLELKGITLFLLGFGLYFRLSDLESPRSIVFDELHYGRFITMYLNRIFFFDTQPPLGKQLVSMAASYYGYDGSVPLSNSTGIGGEYAPNVSIYGLRFVPAICGGILPYLIYRVSLALGLTEWTSGCIGIFSFLENSLLTQSRFLLMDPIMMAFSTIGIYCVVKSMKKELTDSSYYIYLVMSGVFCAFGFSVKFSAGYTLLFCLILSTFNWLTKRVPDAKLTHRQLFSSFSCIGVSFILIPIFIYSTIFMVHLSWLTKAGPHDNILTSAFQASLEGGLASITKGQPLEIVHGSQITLRHTHGRTCWLHSHANVYPVKYSDQRGSSHQQQVTCYSFKDVNNWWIVKKPDYDQVVVREPLERIRNGDIIQLVHGLTGRLLNSHDVAAPMSPHNQEVSCYIDYNISMASQNLWQVQLINPESTNSGWYTIQSQVHLIHVNSSQALKFSGKQLPDWGFNQHEVVVDRDVDQEDTVWNVEEHRYTRDEDAKDRERDLVQAEFVPLAPTEIGFWAKMKELQYKMLVGGGGSSSTDAVEEHMFESPTPFSWFTMGHGIAYWISSTSNSQVFLIGNFSLWIVSFASIIVAELIYLFLLIRRRRGFMADFGLNFNEYQDWMIFILIGYLIHFVPYFFYEKSLFLNFYLPALMFHHIGLGALLSVSRSIIRSYSLAADSERLMVSIEMALIAIFVYNFILFLPFSYGSGDLTRDQVHGLKWRETWHFIVHKP